MWRPSIYSMRSPYDGENKGFQYQVNETNLAEPLSVDELKVEGRIQIGNIDDARLARIITQERRRLENNLGWSITQKTITMFWESFASRVRLPFPHHRQVASVKTLVNDVESTVSNYRKKGLNEIVLDFSTSSVLYGTTASLIVEVEAGYQDGTVPVEFSEALFDECMYQYELAAASEEDVRRIPGKGIDKLGAYMRNFEI